MKVFKFGGASVSTVDRIRNTKHIVEKFIGTKTLIVVSAMGKTTNQLETVVNAYFGGNKEEALSLFAAIKHQHLLVAEELSGKSHQSINILNDFFTEVEWLLHDKPVRTFDYYYDQIVCTGELLSSAIVSQHYVENDIRAAWIDVRDVFRTDNTFRDALVDWDFSAEMVKEKVVPLFDEYDVVVTQGFIGSTADNESTTLGREGSDYSAAIFASMLDAEHVTIWKDVEGLMNADPKKFPDAVIIPELNYEEVIEMAFYGAQVIHPKTIQPLQNKSIALLVKSFLDPTLPGTIIHNSRQKNLPPIIVVKEAQALLHLRSKDFSFVGEKPMADLYHLFAEVRIKPNLVQTGAVSISICLDDKADKIERLAAEASNLFDVMVERGLQLLTIRHFNQQVLNRMIENKTVQLRQESRETVQVVY